jgi:hypothetical protein
MAGFATRTSFAGRTSHGGKTDHALTFNPATGGRPHVDEPEAE